MELRDGVLTVPPKEELATRIVDAALAFQAKCYVYGDDGQFDVRTLGAADEARELWSLLDAWRIADEFGG